MRELVGASSCRFRKLRYREEAFSLTVPILGWEVEVPVATKR